MAACTRGSYSSTNCTVVMLDNKYNVHVDMRMFGPNNDPNEHVLLEEFNVWQSRYIVNNRTLNGSDVDHHVTIILKKN